MPNDLDPVITIPRSVLRDVLDVATQSMDFGSGFLDDEQVESLRRAAEALGDVDLTVVTPHNFTCKYKGGHEWGEWRPYGHGTFEHRMCTFCRHEETRPVATGTMMDAARASSLTWGRTPPASLAWEVASEDGTIVASGPDARSLHNVPALETGHTFRWVRAQA